MGTQNFMRIEAHLTAKIFRQFTLFDTLVRTRGYLRPLSFGAIMLVFSGICFYFQNIQRGAALLGAVLLLIGLGLPAAFFSGIFRFIDSQSVRLGLSRKKKGSNLLGRKASEDEAPLPPKHIFTLTLSPDGIRVEGGKEPLELLWDNVFALYRLPGLTCLYMAPDQAYLLPDSDVAKACGPTASGDEAWLLASSLLPPEKCFDRRK